MVKLYSIFINTIYRISWRITLLFILLVIIFIFGATWFELDLALFEKEGVHVVAQHRIMACILLIIDDIILNMVVLGLFVYKLRKIVLDIAEEEVTTQFYDVKCEFNEKQIRERSSSFTYSLSEKINLHSTTDRKAKLLLIVTRLTVLCIFQSILNQLFFLLMIWVSIINDRWYTDKHKEDLLMWYSLCYIMRGIEGVINSVVLYCNFEINRNVYQFLCGACDKLCYDCFVSRTIKKLVASLN